MNRSAVDAIIGSLRSVAGVRLSVNAEFFGKEWAASSECQQERYHGTISKWHKKADNLLYIKWEGWPQNTSTKLDALVGETAEGCVVGCRLHDYEDGRPAPVYVEPAAPAANDDAEADEAGRGGGAGDAGGGGADGHAPMPPSSSVVVGSHHHGR